MRRRFQLSVVILQLRWIAGYCLAPLLLIVVAALALTGCGTMPRTRSTQFDLFQDMRHQEKFKPQRETPLFSDHRTSRRPPEGTVARGFLAEPDVMNTGLETEVLYAGKNPVPVNAELMELGQARFNVYCTPCHDRAGTGKGTVALKAPTFLPSNLHDERIKKVSDGELFYTITNGKRAMPPYKYQIPNVHDRWAIVAYVRALQRMSSGSIEDVPEDKRASLGPLTTPTLLPPPPPPPGPPPAAGGAAGTATPGAPGAAPASTPANPAAPPAGAAK